METHRCGVGKSEGLGGYTGGRRHGLRALRLWYVACFIEFIEHIISLSSLNAMHNHIFDVRIYPGGLTSNCSRLVFLSSFSVAILFYEHISRLSCHHQRQFRVLTAPTHRFALSLACRSGSRIETFFHQIILCRHSENLPISCE